MSVEQSVECLASLADELGENPPQFHMSTINPTCCDQGSKPGRLRLTANPLSYGMTKIMP
jgi:hypothetical protein